MPKSDFEAFPFLIIALVIGGVMAGFGAYTNRQIQTQFDDQTTTNQSINFASNNTFYDFSGTPAQSVSMVANRTVALSSISYDWNENQIRIYTNASSANGGANISTGTYNVSFTYEGSTEHRALVNATRGIGNLTSWYGLIGTVLAAVAVLGLVGGMVYVLTKS